MWDDIECPPQVERLYNSRLPIFNFVILTVSGVEGEGPVFAFLAMRDHWPLESLIGEGGSVKLPIPVKLLKRNF